MDTKRLIVIVMDSAGVGALPDADQYGDVGSDTLGHITENIEVNLPNLAKLGLGNIVKLRGVGPVDSVAGAYGKMAEASAGKDTTTGHWEIAGIVLDQPFPTYPHGFPQEVIEAFEKITGRQTLGNKVASGTAIIDELGEEHMRTGNPIVYTSADSVFQIAAHEEIIPLDQLYAMCQQARDLLQGEHGVGRVIARPFVGQPGAFQRTTNRHDYSMQPPKENLLTVLTDNNVPVYAVGKIFDIYAGQGITDHVSIKSNLEGMEKTLEYLRGKADRGLIFTNLVDFDMVYGHRRNVQGYAQALEEFDGKLGELLAELKNGDVLVVTADHGCDPSYTGTDHTREYVPVMVVGDLIKTNITVGIRQSFADLGATIAAAFGQQLPKGNSFWTEITK